MGRRKKRWGKERAASAKYAAEANSDICKVLGGEEGNALRCELYTILFPGSSTQ